MVDHQPEKRAGFSTTHWSLVLEAGDSRSPEYREALEKLCLRYWQPVYSYIRRQGHPLDRAQDLTQGFFAQLLEKHYVKAATPERGRFRSFLLTSVKNYLANEWDRQSALKRGGGRPALPLDFDDGEKIYSREPVETKTPEEVYERRWARAILDEILKRLAAEMEAAGHLKRFRLLQPFLTERPVASRYRDIGRALNLSESAVKVAVHRMRKRFGVLMREEIGQTLEHPSQVDDEIRHLLSILG